MDPRIEVLKRVEIGQTRVRAFRGFIFLCGGPQDFKNPKVISIRDAIGKELSNGSNSDLNDRIKVPEEIDDWSRNGIYRDLVTFESHLASLASLIILVVESPGSIAELGVFSSIEAFSERLIAIVAEREHAQQSFIRLGPLQHLENIGRPVLVYDWHDEAPGRSLNNFVKFSSQMPDLLGNIRLAATDTQSGQQIFKADNALHVMLLIVDLCDLFGALSQKEVHDYLVSLALGLAATTVTQYLFVLEKCEMLFIKARGNGRYYYTKSSRSLLSFAFVDRQSMDYDRLRIDVITYLDKHNQTRAEVIRQVKRRDN